MKKLSIVLLLAANFLVFAQESKLHFRSFSIGHGASTTFSEKFDSGLNLGIDVSFARKKDIFGLNLNSGGFFNFFGETNSYTEINFDYGRELRLTRWLAIEGHAGLGYIKFTRLDINYFWRNHHLIGVPLRSKVLFYCNERFALGVGAYLNLNSFVTLYSGNLVFQWKFK